jgi:magnesium-transporting ATPase (P-type)
MNMASGFVQATIDAFILFFLTKASFGHSVWEQNGESLGIAVFGNAVFCNMVFAMLYKIMLLFWSWNAWVFFGFFFSYALYIGFIFFYTAIGPADVFGGEYEFYDVPQHLFGNPGFLMTLLLIPVVTFLIDFVIKAIKVEFFTTRDMAAREYESMLASGQEGMLFRKQAESADARSNGTGPELKVTTENIAALHENVPTNDLQRSGLSSLHHRSSFAFDYVGTEFGARDSDPFNPSVSGRESALS